MTPIEELLRKIEIANGDLQIAKRKEEEALRIFESQPKPAGAVLDSRNSARGRLRRRLMDSVLIDLESLDLESFKQHIVNPDYYSDLCNWWIASDVHQAAQLKVNELVTQFIIEVERPPANIESALMARWSGLVAQSEALTAMIKALNASSPYNRLQEFLPEYNAAADRLERAVRSGIMPGDMDIETIRKQAMLIQEVNNYDARQAELREQLKALDEPIKEAKEAYIAFISAPPRYRVAEHNVNLTQSS
jgi:hypothetical protein